MGWSARRGDATESSQSRAAAIGAGDEGVCAVRAAVQLAEEVGAGLGGGEVLFRSVSARDERRAGHPMTVSSELA